MEHPCHRCGDPVPDSSPFCPECGAPQIRFDRPEAPAEGVSIHESAATPAPPPPVVQRPPGHETDHRVAGRERAVAVRSALNGGVVAAVLSFLPLGFIIGMPLGGFLAVFFYRRRSWRAEPTPGAGFRLGALAGLCGFILLLIALGISIYVFKSGDQVRQQAIETLRWANSRYPDPQHPEAYKYFTTQQGLPIFLALSAFLMGIISVVLAGVGGAFGASFLHRKGPKA